MEKIEELESTIKHLEGILESYSDPTKKADAVGIRYGNHSTTFIDVDTDFSEIIILLSEKVKSKIEQKKSLLIQAQKEEL